jgi:hypothetical protein
MSNGGKGDDRRPQFEDDATVTANWARIAGHADGCTVTKEWKASMTCCAGRNEQPAQESA